MIKVRISVKIIQIHSAASRPSLNYSFTRAARFIRLIYDLIYPEDVLEAAFLLTNSSFISYFPANTTTNLHPLLYILRTTWNGSDAIGRLIFRLIFRAIIMLVLRMELAVVGLGNRTEYELFRRVRIVPDRSKP